jgi:hypothetical protein
MQPPQRLPEPPSVDLRTHERDRSLMDRSRIPRLERAEIGLAGLLSAACPPVIEPYGFSSDLVVTASDQRVDAVIAASVTMPDAVPTASVAIRVRSMAPHQLH